MGNMFHIRGFWGPPGNREFTSLPQVSPAPLTEAAPWPMLRWRTLSSWLRLLLLVLALAAVYIVTARLGLLLALPPEGKATAVWPPSGIALAAVLLLGYRVWPGIWLGAFLANFWDYFGAANQFPLGTHLTVSAGIAVGSTLQPLLGAYLLHRWAGEDASILDRVPSVFKFMAVALVMCLVAPNVGVTTMALAGYAPWANYGFNWWTWWVGDTTSIFLMTPILLAWSKPMSYAGGPGRLAEAGLLLALLVALGLAFFGARTPWGPQALAPVHDAVPPLILAAPLLVWAAFRFGQRGATAAMLLMAGFAIWGASQGVGPFVRDSLNNSLIFLQIFVAGLTVMALSLVAVLAERQKAVQAQSALAHENDVLAEIGRVVSSSLDINRVYEQFAQRVRQLIPFDRIAIVIPDVAGGTVSTVYTSGQPVPGLERGSSRPLAGSPLEQVMVTCAGMLVQGDNHEEMLRLSPGAGRGVEAGLDSMIMVPLVSQQQVVGGLALRSYQPNRYSRDQLALAERIGLQIGGAIANARLHEEVKLAEQTIRELSTPILPVADQLLVAPIIGVMYPQRARQLADQLLSAIGTHRARAVVIDVTGTAALDPEVTGLFMQTLEAARLLGVSIFLTGVSTGMTQALADHYPGLRDIYFMGDLQAGTEAAQRLLAQQGDRRNHSGDKLP